MVGSMLARAMVVLAMASVGLPAVADTSAAVAVVEQFHGTLKAALRSDGFEARRALLAEPIAAAFDVATIARISVGAHWRELGDAQRNELVQTLTDLIVATYAARFDTDNGQEFETLDAQETRPGRILVRTRLHLKERDDVTLDYMLRQSDGPPTIYNVIADGVSDLSLRRAEYSAIIERDGFDALLAALRESAREFAEGEVNA